MEQNRLTHDICICGPDGSPLTLADLPSPTTKRWVPSRKAQVVVAVEGGLLSFREACERYNLTLEEFQHWEVELHLHGLGALRRGRMKRSVGRSQATNAVSVGEGRNVADTRPRSPDRTPAVQNSARD